MKYLLVIIVFLFSFIGILFQNEVKWTPNEKLKWSDFKKKLSTGANELALLDGGIKSDFEQKKDSTVSVVIYAFYDKNLSSKSEDINALTERGLKHEQGHFDIWEWYARVLRKKLIDTTLIKFNQTTAIFNLIYKEANNVEDRYDKETNHSNDTTAQRKWEALIKQKLDEYSGYSNTEFQIYIKKRNKIKSQ
jgi:hypothetical protein